MSAVQASTSGHSGRSSATAYSAWRAGLGLPEGLSEETKPKAGTLPPVVEIVRTAYTEDGNPVEVNEMVTDASAYVFRYDFTTA
jgi:hypothetical protein